MLSLYFVQVPINQHNYFLTYSASYQTNLYTVNISSRRLITYYTWVGQFVIWRSYRVYYRLLRTFSGNME